MPAPDTWDQPGQTFDSGGTWDGAGATKKSTAMPYTKAIVNFSQYKDGELGGVAQYVHDQMTANAATFATPPVTMAALQTLVTDYLTKYGAKASRSTADRIAFDAAREALEDALARLGNYVNDLAQGDPAVVEKSGIPSYETTHAADPTPPPAPTNLRLKRGAVSRSVVARWKSQRPTASHEVQINTGNPNTEADWNAAGIFQGQRAELADLTIGAHLWVRVRTVGLRGVMGDWSDPAEVIVT